MWNWLQEHGWLVAVLSGGTGIVAALIGIAFLLMLPEDYFLQKKNPLSITPHGVLPWILLVLKNMVGIIIILLGGIMTLPLIPGPGLVSVVIGLSMTNFPGKHKLELMILRTPLVLGAVNWLRAKGGRSPFCLPSAHRRSHHTSVHS